MAQRSPAALFIASVLSPVAATQFLAGSAPEVPSSGCQGLARTSALRVPPTASCPARVLLRSLEHCPAGLCNREASRSNARLSTALIAALIAALITGLPA